MGPERAAHAGAGVIATVAAQMGPVWARPLPYHWDCCPVVASSAGPVTSAHIETVISHTGPQTQLEQSPQESRHDLATIFCCRVGMQLRCRGSVQASFRGSAP